MAKKTAPKANQKSNKKSAKKPAAKTAKPAAKTAAKKPAAKKSAKAKTATKSAKAKAPAKKPAAKTSSKLKSPAQSAGKSITKTAAKMAGAVAAVGAIAGVAFSKVKVASKSKSDVSAVFSPLDDRVLIEEVKTELRTAGGLFIPDTVTQADGPREGVVLAVGRGRLDKKGRLRPLDVKKGDTVLFEAYLGSAIKIGDREVTVLRESQLLGVKND